MFPCLNVVNFLLFPTRPLVIFGYETVHFEKETIMQCCGSGMFIPDPNFSLPDPGSKRFRIPDPHQRIEVLLTQIVSKLSEIRFMDGHPGSRIRILIFTHPVSRSRDKKNTRSRIRIRNNAESWRKIQLLLRCCIVFMVIRLRCSLGSYCLEDNYTRGDSFSCGGLSATVSVLCCFNFFPLFLLFQIGFSFYLATFICIV